MRCYGAFAIITKISFCWWWDHVIQSACKLLICPPTLMQSNLPWSSPLHHSFSFSVGPYCPTLIYFTSVQVIKNLVDGKKLTINILCPKPLTLQVKCVTFACVAVMLSVAECDSISKYTLVSYVYPDSSQNLLILMLKISFLWNVLPEDNSALEFYSYLAHCQML